MFMFCVVSSSWQTMATSILPPPIVKWSYLQDLSAPKKSSFGFLTSSGLMQCLLDELRCSAMLFFIWSAYWAGMPGMFISCTVTFDSHNPGWTMESLVMTPDCFTACVTWLAVAYLRLSSGPLLQAVRQRTDASAYAACFMMAPSRSRAAS